MISTFEQYQRAGFNTSWWAKAALLQKAVVTATEVSFLLASWATRSTADDSVIDNSSGVIIPLCFGYAITESSVGFDLIRHSEGMVASSRALLSSTTCSHVMVAIESEAGVKDWCWRRDGWRDKSEIWIQGVDKMKPAPTDVFICRTGLRSWHTINVGLAGYWAGSTRRGWRWIRGRAYRFVGSPLQIVFKACSGHTRSKLG